MLQLRKSIGVRARPSESAVLGMQQYARAGAEISKSEFRGYISVVVVMLDSRIRQYESLDVRPKRMLFGVRTAETPHRKSELYKADSPFSSSLYYFVLTTANRSVAGQVNVFPRIHAVEGEIKLHVLRHFMNFLCSY